MVLTSPRATAQTFRIPPPASFGDISRIIEEAENGDFSGLRDMLWQFVEWQRVTGEVVTLLLDGKDNATGTVTLTVSSATTTLSDPRIGAQTKVILVPTTANALADVPYQTFPNTTEGQATLNHANNANADRTFGYLLRG